MTLRVEVYHEISVIKMSLGKNGSMIFLDVRHYSVVALSVISLDDRLLSSS